MAASRPPAIPPVERRRSPPLRAMATRCQKFRDSFGNGPRTIRVRKSYWTQANPATGVKPQQQWVDAYELAFHVNAPGAPLLANPGAPPPPPSTSMPGVVKPGQ